MSKKAVWVYDGAILARGVNSRDEFVQIVREEGGHGAAWALGLDVQSRPEEFDLAVGQPEAFRVPIGHYRLEGWDGAYMYRCTLDDQPGRGFVKVVIFDPHMPVPASGNSGEGGE